MKRNTRLAAVALSTLLALSMIGPGLAVADTESPNGNLAVDASVNDGVLVTVTDDGEAAANATVNVTVDDGDASPDDETVADGNETIEDSNETADDDEPADRNASVDTGADAYAGAGTYTTDENGTLELPTPEERLNATIRATVGDRTATTRETLPADSGNATGPIAERGTEQPFGFQVAAFVRGLSEVGDGTVGQRVAEFATSNNPGDPPAHAGPGNATAGNRTGSANGTGTDGRVGPPAHAGPDGDGGPPAHAGPPEHAGPGSDDADGDEDTDADRDDDADEADGDDGADERAEGTDRDDEEGSTGGGPGNSGNAPGNGDAGPGNGPPGR
jgi:hypothetical protein